MPSHCPSSENLWAPDYVDDLVAHINSPTLGYYVQQDANWNVTAVVDPDYGTPEEHYTYDPYGKVSYYDSAWNQLSSSSVGMQFFFQGGSYGFGLYSFRNRDYSPTLGRWMQQDAIGFRAGQDNLYEFVRDDPVKYNDPSGTQINPCVKTPVLRSWERIGGGWGEVMTITCRSVAGAVRTACDAVAFALDLITNKWPSVTAKQWYSAGMKLLLQNRQFYIDIFQKVVAGCKGNSITIWCHSCVWPGCYNARERYIRTAYVSQAGGTIHLCPRSFGKGDTVYPNILYHEFGRVFAFDELPDLNTDTVRDIKVYDYIIYTLNENFGGVPLSQVVSGI